MMKTYEATPHTLKIPKPVFVDATTAPATDGAGFEATREEKDQRQQRHHHQDNNLQRQEILNGGAAFVLKNFLTPQECQDFIDQAETIGLNDCGYSKRIRKTDRVAAKSNEVARFFFARLEPFLEPSIDLTRKPDTARYPEGISKSMSPCNWLVSGLNPTFRICRYQPRGFFFPHHDGGFFIDEYNQSIRTFMIYLNDDFQGGETCFYNELQRHYQKPDPDNIVYSYQPEKGDALIFNSNITHDGGKVRNGKKYIMRSEIMYCARTCARIEQEQEAHRRDHATPDHDPDTDFTWP